MNNEHYEDSLQRLLDICTEDSLCLSFAETILGGSNAMSVYRKHSEKRIDEEWVDFIEEKIPYLDTAIRKPRLFFTEEEEILPIELTKKVSPASIKHLAQHTNLIRSFEDGNVVPSHLLNTFKEESYDTYENKFVYTLLYSLYLFVTKRYDLLSKTDEDENSAALNMESEMSFPSGETVRYKLEISAKSAPAESHNKKHTLKSDLLRVERIQKVVSGFMGSEFAEIMKKFPMIKPPVMRTNAIMKDVNLKQCLSLWMFIHAYDKAGYEIISKDGFVDVPKTCVDDLYSSAAIQFALFKRYSDTRIDDPLSSVSAPVRPSTVKLLVKRLAESYDYYDVEVQRVINTEIGLAASKKALRDKKITIAIDRAIEAEKSVEREAKRQIEKLRRDEKEREKLERAKARAERRKLAEKEKKKQQLIDLFEKKNEGKKSSSKEKAKIKLEKRLKEIDGE